jgi:hypothetical protein
MTQEKKVKSDLSEGDDFNLISYDKLINITKLHKVSNIESENNIFGSKILLETISSDLRRLEQRIDSLQKNQALLRKDLVEAGVLKLKI